MRPVEPLFTAHLFGPLHRELLRLLRGLSDDDWRRPTAAGSWRVRDVVAHLLDGDTRQISFRRDRLEPAPPEDPIESFEDLVRFLEGLNAVWVKASQRMSPRFMLELHERTGPEVARLFEEADPFGQAPFGVAWAGEMASAHWFDTAREYTERWHHQQQIREAVGAPSLTGREWLHPVIDTFLRALPHAYRDTGAGEGASIRFVITGDAGGEWTLRRESAAWRLYAGTAGTAACTVTADTDTTWRLLTKGLTPEAAASRARVDGPPELARPFLGMLAIMGVRDPTQP